MGRKGYSRMAHDMKKQNPNIKALRTKVWTSGHLKKDGTTINEAVSETLIEDCAQSIFDTPAEDSIRDDAIARVLGPERRGSVRGLGFGVTPSKVYAQVQSNGRVRELESQLESQAARMVALEKTVDALLKLSQQNQSKSAEDISSHAFSPQSQEGSGIQGVSAQMENKRCQLLHWYKFDNEGVVAEGKIASTDPSAKVHHMPLGRDCWKVWVEEVIVGDLNLYPQMSLKFLLKP